MGAASGADVGHDSAGERVEVAGDGAGVGDGHVLFGVCGDGSCDEFGFGLPPAVHGGLVDAGAGCDLVDVQLVVADLGQQGKGVPHQGLQPRLPLMSPRP
jgi:hypothetical protein